MNAEKIGSQGVPREPVKPPFEKQDVGIQVKKTQQKDQIPSATSQQIGLPHKHIVKSIEQLHDQLPTQEEKEVQNIEAQTKMVGDSNALPRGPMQDLAKVKVMIDLGMEKKERRKSIKDVEAIVTGIQIPANLMHDLATEPYSYFEPFLFSEEMKGTINKIVMPLEAGRTALQSVELVSTLTATIVQAAHFQEVKNLLKEKETELLQNPTDEKLKIFVARMRNYSSVQWEILKEKIIDLSTSFASVSLKTTNFVLDSIKFVNPLVKSSVGWAISLLDVLTETITLWRAQKAKTTHDAWMTQISKNQRTFQQAQDLLGKRQERMILRKAEKLRTFSALSESLQKKGVGLTEKNIVTMKEFKIGLSDPTFRKEIVEKFLEADDEKEDTINTMTRNGIQALAETKVKNEKKFFDFKLISSKISLSLACLSAALAITLEVLAIVGVIALAASTLALPGLGFFILGIALAGIGLYFFYKHRPNLFSCFIRAVNLRLAFFQIPSKIRSLQLSGKKNAIRALESTSARYEQLEGLLKQKQTLDGSSYPKELQTVLEKLRKEVSRKIDEFDRLAEDKKLQKFLDELKNKKNKYAQTIEEAKKREQELNKKVQAWTGKNGMITKLQERLTEAGNKDFAIANHLITTAQNEKLNLPIVLVEKILDPNFDFTFDEETDKILREKMGIDIGQIQTVGGRVDREQLVHKLKEFFKMDDAQLLTFMKRQLKSLKGKPEAIHE